MGGKLQKGYSSPISIFSQNCTLEMKLKSSHKGGLGSNRRHRRRRPIRKLKGPSSKRRIGDQCQHTNVKNVEPCCVFCVLKLVTLGLDSQTQLEEKRTAANLDYANQKEGQAKPPHICTIVMNYRRETCRETVSYQRQVVCERAWPDNCPKPSFCFQIDVCPPRRKKYRPCKFQATFLRIHL